MSDSIRKAKKGRKPAGHPAANPDEQFAELYGLVRFEVWRRLAGVPYNWIQDVAQDVALAFLERLRSGKVKDPRPYLYFVAQGMCSDFLSLQRDADGFRVGRFTGSYTEQVSNRGAAFDDNGDNIYPLTNQDACPDRGEYDPVAFCIRREALLRARRLRAEMRDILGVELYRLWLRFVNGLTYREIAQAFGLTPDQVRGRIARSRPRLRRTLRQRGFDRNGNKTRAGKA